MTRRIPPGYSATWPHMSARRGGGSTFTDVPTTWSDTPENAVTENYIRTSPFARVAYDTTATSITINSYNNSFATFPGFTELGLLVDGVFQSVAPGGAGARSNTVSLPAGEKRIEIVNGLQSRPSGAIVGTYLVSLEANAPLIPVDPVNGGGLLFYGDSITVGANADYPTGEGHAMLVRATADIPVGVEGFGFRSLWDDCKDATARAAFVAKIVTWNPNNLWIGIGHNDYFLDRWSSTDFGAAYAALLDDLHTALPDLGIYAQSPIVRNPDPTNDFGETLTDYRAEVETAATGRAWVTFIDGLDIIGSRSLADGVHPTTDGHFGMAEFINLTLGYTSPPSSLVIANRANTTVTGPDLYGMYRIEKTAGANGWIASADAGLTALNGDFRLRMVIRNEPFDRVIGVRMTDPTEDNGYTGIQYAFYDAAVWEGLPPIPTGDTYLVDFRRPSWIIREGTTLTYRYGYDPDAATVLRTVTGVAGSLYLDTSLFQNGSIADVAVYTT